jgi:hypothetical protein
MRFLRRRRRRSVGPAPVDADRLDSSAPTERIVEEGMLIVELAVRMTVRNAIVLSALRDHNDFDARALKTVARNRLLDLADEEDDAARRAGQRDGGNPDDRGRRLMALRLGVAVALRQRAADPDFVDGILRHARDAALEDIASTMMTSPVKRTPDYDTRRADRIASFVGFDLTELAARQGIDLMDL